MNEVIFVDTTDSVDLLYALMYLAGKFNNADFRMFSCKGNRISVNYGDMILCERHSKFCYIFYTDFKVLVDARLVSINMLRSKGFLKINRTDYINPNKIRFLEGFFLHIVGLSDVRKVSMQGFATLEKYIDFCYYDI
ncbi:MAG: hypothetical protein K6F55_08900 [Eubacterium sp.]|nr:hypothetical protein [Eubacterium sp.]